MSEFKYVPVEPTDEMINESLAPNGYGVDGYPKYHTIQEKYKAMIAAAPTHPSPAESDKESVRNAALEECAAYVLQVAELDGGISLADDIRALKTTSGSEVSQPAQPSDTEILDWVTENRAIVDYYGNGYRVCFIDDGSFYPEVYPTIQEAIKAAMRAEREGS